MEIWKDIVGYEGMYQVSNLGNVKSLKRKKWNGFDYQEVIEKVLEKAAEIGQIVYTPDVRSDELSHNDFSIDKQSILDVKNLIDFS